MWKTEELLTPAEHLTEQRYAHMRDRSRRIRTFTLLNFPKGNLGDVMD
jgi:hypothetical protein